MEAFFAISLFLVLCACLLAGFPVAFTLAGVSLIFALIGNALGIFDLSILIAWPSRIFGTMINATLFAVPLFILMGLVLERSNIARDLLQALGRLFGQRPGGMALAVTIVSTLLAASTGIVGATVVMMGLLALPVMIERHYDHAFSAGTIAASSTLGVIIPPSILLILLGDVLASAYGQAQNDLGLYASDTISVGDLFAGALFPGLMIAGLFMLYQYGFARFNPHRAPAPETETEPEQWSHLLRILIAPLALIIAVLGSILVGAATPTEAAAVGSIGACLIAAERFAHRTVWIALLLIALLAVLKTTQTLDLNLDPADLSFSSLIAIILFLCFIFCLLHVFYLLWKANILTPTLQGTARMTSMVFAILICAGLFTLVFRGFGGDELIRGALENIPGGKWSAFAIVMIAIFLLGFILDFIEITFIVVPIVAPILILLGFDPVWLGVMIAINLQTSFLTPPFGFALFYLRGVAPDSIKTISIYKGVIPFIVIQLIGLIMVALFPQIAVWLPSALFD